MRPTVRRLAGSDAAGVDAVLMADPVVNVYLRSELLLGALASSGRHYGAGWWGVEAGGSLRGVLAGGPLAVPWLPVEGDCDAVAARLVREIRPRTMVGPRLQVLALHAAWHPPQALREVRDPQPLLLLRRGGLRAASSPGVRPATAADLDRLLVASAHMHLEEMGVDPLAVDPVGWRARMGVLVDRRWSWVWMEGGRIVFKAELSAWTPEAVQIQGVWTDPACRGRGVATAGLASVCETILRTVPACQLYVNHFNAPALAVYRRLGFEHVGDFATLMY